PLANAETIDAGLAEISSAGSSSAGSSAAGSSAGLRDSARRRVALVEGSAPQMSGETRCLLRSRLRMVAVLLFIGFAVFLGWSLFELTVDARWDEFRAMFFVHIGVTVVLGLLAWKLCRKCELPLGGLRVAEALVFGIPGLFFVLMNYQRLHFAATQM